MDRRGHWDQVYAAKRADEVSWHQRSPQRSLALIGGLGLGAEGAIIDVGAGASSLVDELLARGFRRITTIDIAAAALEHSRARLGERARLVRWVVGDVLDEIPGGPYDLWHDRAVFHFLTDAADRERYAANLRAALAPGGHAIIATFAPDGPQKCSGLEVARHDGASIAAAVGLRLVKEEREEHVTPWGAVQRFVYAVLGGAES
ncbi:MAG TPA: class I SAM-dependent methyltransferase [Phycisphaerales bacterium]|nr:class I SAM-dependent methyltransferase [Phycisphaerales bacterium]